LLDVHISTIGVETGSTMFAFPKLLRLYTCVLLALVLGMAGTARASHEANAPAQVFFSITGQAVSGQTCLSLHVDQNGSPVNTTHIHGCANCVLGFEEILVIDPPSIVIIMQLVAPKRLSFDQRPTLRLASKERVSPHAPRAPPAFS
jgi:hypothetical protein